MARRKRKPNIKARKSGLTRLQVKRMVGAILNDDAEKIAALALKAKKWNMDEGIDWNLSFFTPLECAVGGKSTKVVRYLLEAGADPNRCRFGWTPLIQACDISAEEIVDLLLTHGADVNIASGGTRNERGQTALMQACMRGDLVIARKLLAAGADPTLATADGRNALTQAASPKKQELVTILLKAGATPLASALISPVQNRSHLFSIFSDTPEKMPWEELSPYMQAIKMAISHKVPVDIRFSLDGEIRKTKGDTLLGCAARSGDLEVVKALIAAGANVDELTLDNPPIVMAASNDHPEIVKVLIDAGANLEAFSMFGRTALATAVDKGNVECVKILRNAGASPRRRGKGPLAKNALELAREKGNQEMAAALRGPELGPL